MSADQRGLLICLLGVDGAGKSTQAQALVARLQAAGYPARYVWGGRKPLLTGPVVRLAKARLRAPRRPTTASITVNPSYRAYVQETQRMFKNGLLRSAWQQVALAEHALHLWRHVTLPLQRGMIVVCDRYIYDTLVNQAVLFGLPSACLKLIDAPHVSRPDLGFWLDVPPEIALRRKPDVYDRQHLERRIPLYASLAIALGFQRIDATRSADAVANEIWLAVLTRLVSASRLAAALEAYPSSPRK